jgi:hypothetical protein
MSPFSSDAGPHPFNDLTPEDKLKRDGLEGKQTKNRRWLGAEELRQKEGQPAKRIVSLTGAGGTSDLTTFRWNRMFRQ